MSTTTTYILLIFTLVTFAQKPSNLFEIEPILNKTTNYTSNLNIGQKLDDLSWGWNSSNACFSATQKDNFNGNHVFFTSIIPENSTYKISLTPKKNNYNINLYAYEIKLSNNYLVPNLPNSIRCMSDITSESNTREVVNQVLSKEKFRLVIGVVGANKLNEGEFSIKIKISNNP